MFVFVKWFGAVIEFGDLDRFCARWVSPEVLRQAKRKEAKGNHPKAYRAALASRF